jgi:preprotein translocase subunit SecA
MFQKILRFFNNHARNNQRILRHMDGLIGQINRLEDTYRELSDEDLAKKTTEFKTLYAQGTPLDELLVPAFATVREASRRVLGMRPFDVQLCGGIALHKGMIAEMKTGEGKTLVATLPVYLNALTGKGVHVVTVNDYLAQRDSSSMRPLYEFLGLSVGCIVQDLSHFQRHQAYHSDITYGTNNEFGFDYLKDNMKFSPDEMCQRGFAYAIVDEVDSILIDEARTPLIISGPAEGASDLYATVNEIITHLKPEHYEIEEKTKSVAFTDQGYIEVEKLTKQAGMVSGTDLFQPANLMLVHHLNQSLKAHKTFQKDVDYIVKDGKVILIDEFTGRMMKGRRYSDGLHQAIEAKEHVEIEVENQTLASITFQNYFRMYEKLAGMTGTGETEAVEFHDIYKMPVLSIPTNVPVERKDLEDEIFRIFDQKLQVVLKQIKECHDRLQPVLVGTLSIEKSEVFARALKKLGVPFSVLNARHHEQEARIIAQAGSPGAITIATNMAGRGTDIKLGGNLDVMLAEGLQGIEDPQEREQIAQNIRKKHEEQEEIVRKAGGLFVLGTERNENRRIDNQLRGRSGRQGDPGASKFFISLDDDLMRIFGPNLKMLDYSLRKTEQSDTDPIAHPWLTRSIEKAQQKVEAQHFDTRKHLLKYADVLNAQRTAVYEERHFLINAQDVHPLVLNITQSLVTDMVHQARDPKKSGDQGDLAHLSEALVRIFNINVDFTDQDRASSEEIQAKIMEKIREKQDSFTTEWGLEMRTRMEKSLMLKTLDQTWIAHLNAMDHLRSGIHLQAYGQKDPLNEYRHEAFVMFKAMKSHWHTSFLTSYYHANPQHIEQYEEEDEDIEELLKKWSYQHASMDENDGDEAQAALGSEESSSNGAVNYREVLDKLLAQDRDWDPESFDEDDLDALWGNDVRGEKAVKKGGKKGLSRDASGSGSGSGHSGKKQSPANAHSSPSSGKKQGAFGKSTNTPNRALASPSSPRQKQRPTPKQANSASPTQSMGKFVRTDLSVTGTSPGKKAYAHPFSRRAPSKRGPYVPKNNNEFDPLMGGQDSSGQRRDSTGGRAPTTRWQSPRNANSAVPHPRDGERNTTRATPMERTGGGARRALSSRDPNALSSQFYASRIVGGGRAFARSRLGRQQAGAEDLGRSNVRQPMGKESGAMGSRSRGAAKNPKDYGSNETNRGKSRYTNPAKNRDNESFSAEPSRDNTDLGQKFGAPAGGLKKAASRFALSSRRAVGRGPANRGIGKEPVVYETDSYSPSPRGKTNQRTSPGGRPPVGQEQRTSSFDKTSGSREKFGKLPGSSAPGFKKRSDGPGRGEEKPGAARGFSKFSRNSSTDRAKPGTKKPKNPPVSGKKPGPKPSPKRF